MTYMTFRYTSKIIYIVSIIFFRKQTTDVQKCMCVYIYIYIYITCFTPAVRQILFVGIDLLIPSVYFADCH